MSRSRTYSWGRKGYSVSPQVVGETVERIAQRNGRCTPDRLVLSASRPDSPLHSLFTWDNDTAADNWRNHEARNVINNLAITVMVNDQEERVPAFISVGHTEKTQGSGEGYRPFDVIVQTPDFHNEALEEVISRMEALRRRYAALGEMSPVWEALDKVKAA